MKKILIYTILLFLTATSYAQHKVVVKVLSGGSSTSSGVTGVATGYGLSGGPIASTGTIIVDSAALHLKFLGLKDSTLYTTTYQNGLKQPLENQRLSTNNVVYFDISQARILAVRDSLLSTNYSYIYTNPNPVSAATILHLPRTSDTLATQTDIPTIAYKKAQTDSIAALKLGYILVTKAQADSLIAISALKKGYFYEISGCDTATFNDGTNSGNTLILQAAENNKFRKDGIGIFYNPKYTTAYGFGLWTNRSTWRATLTAGTFNANEAITANNGATGTLFTTIDANRFIALTGDWSTVTSITGNVSGATATIASVAVQSYSIGSKIIWGGYSWTNQHGAVGATTDVHSLDTAWSKNAYDTTNYNIAYDQITYDYGNDYIDSRYDAAGANYVLYTYYDLHSQVKGNSLSVFMWGNPSLVRDNKILDSYCETVNLYDGYFTNNILEDYSDFITNVFDSCRFKYNHFSGNANVHVCNMFASLIYGNNNTTESDWGYSNISNSTLMDNVFEAGTFFYHQNISNNSTISYNVFGGGYTQSDTLNNASLKYCSFKNYSGVSGASVTSKTIQFLTAEGDAQLAGNLNSATIIFGAYPKTLYIRPDGTYRLRWYNNSDVQVISKPTD